jgi:hypothetical protein
LDQIFDFQSGDFVVLANLCPMVCVPLDCLLALSTAVALYHRICCILRLIIRAFAACAPTRRNSANGRMRMSAPIIHSFIVSGEYQ